ncbi:MAG: HAD family hydrolase [Phycisphaerae bacterium]
MIKAVIFDLDGTLYEEQDYYKSGFAAVAEFISSRHEQCNAPKITKELSAQFESQNYDKTFNAALDNLGIRYSESDITELIEVFRNHKPNIKLPQQSRDVLDLLNRKYNLGLITDGYLPGQKLKVEALGIEKFFKCIIYTEELGREFWKPSPAAFEKMLKILNVQGENCVYIGDNARKDFVAPNSLGFSTIHIICPSGIHKKPPPGPQAAPKHVIYGISELPNLLDKL